MMNKPVTSSAKATEAACTIAEAGGEFGLHAHMRRWCSVAPSEGVRYGMGDDAAVLERVGKNQLGLFCSDMLLEGLHFDLGYTPLQHLGYKALVVNVSDVVAMGGRPRYAVLSLGLSNRFLLSDVEQLYEGLVHGLQRYEVALVGGDTTASRSGLVLAVALQGEVNEEQLTYRKGAQVGDDLWVSGDLGAAYVGLCALQQSRTHFLAQQEAPNLEAHRYVVGRHLRPDARVDILAQFADLELRPTAMIDVSDGLCSDLLRLCEASGVGVELELTNLPMHAEMQRSAASLELDPLKAACYGGEDYELLFTAPKTARKSIEACKELHRIGHILAPHKGCICRDANGRCNPIRPGGWDHFASNESQPIHDAKKQTNTNTR